MEQQPLQVAGRKQLFIDQRFIAESDGVDLRVNPPERRGLVLKAEGPWEAGWLFSGTLIQEGELLRMWYGGWPVTVPDPKKRDMPPPSFCYAESADGIRWQRPKLGLFEYEGSTENNIIPGGGSSVFRDVNAPAEQAYRMLVVKPGDADNGGIYVATSPDGLRWTEHPMRVFPFYPDTYNQVLYDPRIGKYVAYVRSWAPLRKVARTQMDDLMKPWPYTEIEEPSTLWGEGAVPPPSHELPQAISCDELDPPDMDLYTPCVNIYPYAEDVYLSFTTPYRHDPASKWPNDGLVEVQLAVSRDGVRFERPDRRNAYIPLGIRGGPQGGSIYMGVGMARMGDEIYHYYSALENSHGEYFGYEELKGLGGLYLAVQRLDGFMSADAAYAGGWLVTPPVCFAGDRLELNIDCGATGHARIELRDENDIPLKGYSAEDCDLIRGNHIRYTVTWKGNSNISELTGKAIRLYITMRNTRLFAFQFK